MQNGDAPFLLDGPVEPHVLKATRLAEVHEAPYREITRAQNEEIAREGLLVKRAVNVPPHDRPRVSG